MNHISEPELSLQGGVAIERQIEVQIRDCIAAGQLLPGEQLPTIRAMAVALAVNPSAVGNAYAALEKEGFLTSQDGSGTFVAYTLRSQGWGTVSRKTLEQLCSRFLTQASCLGFSANDVMETIETLTKGRCSS
jgi:GntR family transcriptional regulator